MAVLVINPNSTEAMTASMTAAARAAAPELNIEGWTSAHGPPAIEGPEDGAAAQEPLLSLVAQARDVDGIIIGCFDDTGLEQASKNAPCPVIGIGQAAFHYCALRQFRFGVVTTMAVSIPVIEANIARYGLSNIVTRVRASKIPVLALEADPAAATGPILKEVKQSVTEDGSEAIVLGCAGMINVVQTIRKKTNVPIIDPVEVAATGMQWLTT